MNKNSIVAIKADANGNGNLRFISTKALEAELDGSESKFEDYFFAIYHCSYKEDSGIKDRRIQLSLAYPNNVIKIGDRFVLDGEAAFLALSAYYQALIDADTLSEEFRIYIKEQLNSIIEKHKKSQSLGKPINLTEGQLSYDSRLDFFTCLALNNGMVVAVDKN
jgi:hypothetical protein